MPSVEPLTRVLVVDDEAHIRDVVQYAFEKEGFQVSLAGSGEDALEQLNGSTPDLLVLDVMLPGIDGLQLCRQIRADSTVPILFVSARGEEIDRILGLELGGDDYLPKPFSPRELVARARAILRRGPARPESGTEKATIRHGAVEMDPERHTCQVGQEWVSLTSTEFSVLAAILERPGVVWSRGQLMQRAVEGVVTERTVDTHIKRIRGKFRACGAEDPIVTVHGVGYKASDQ